MKALFVDTSGWVASVNQADLHHAATTRALEEWLQKGGVLVTTDYVVDETMTHMRKRFGLEVTQTWWEKIEFSDRLLVEWVGQERAEKAREIFFRHRDKDYSFTDCTSFVVMKELKLKQALATDKHFAQAGFQVAPAVLN
jgi:predicted nucleic acid-binding protein